MRVNRERIDKVRDGIKNAGYCVRDAALRHGPTIANHCFRAGLGFLLGYGATALVCDLTGVTGQAVNNVANKAYTKGFIDGEQNAANLIGAASGNSVKAE